MSLEICPRTSQRGECPQNKAPPANEVRAQPLLLRIETIAYAWLRRLGDAKRAAKKRQKPNGGLDFFDTIQTTGRKPRDVLTPSARLDYSFSSLPLVPICSALNEFLPRLSKLLSTGRTNATLDAVGNGRTGLSTSVIADNCSEIAFKTCERGAAVKLDCRLVSESSAIDKYDGSTLDFQSNAAVHFVGSKAASEITGNPVAGCNLGIDGALLSSMIVAPESFSSTARAVLDKTPTDRRIK